MSDWIMNMNWTQWTLIIFGISGWVISFLLYNQWKEDDQVWHEIWDSRNKEYHSLKRYLEELEKDN